MAVYRKSNWRPLPIPTPQKPDPNKPLGNLVIQKPVKLSADLEGLARNNSSQPADNGTPKGR